MNTPKNFGPEITPKARMARNAPCWCGSGLKWKKCHRDRDEAPQSNFYDVLPKFRRTFSRGNCLHPDAPKDCNGKVIRSHTVQRGAALSAIAENGHVVSCREAINQIDKNNGRIVPQKTGINIASTFPGFCPKHDTELFKQIESGEITMGHRAGFLLSYRAMAYELHGKRSAMEGFDMLAGADAGAPFELQSMIQMQLSLIRAGTLAALQDLESWKLSLDADYRVDNFDISMFVIKFDSCLPFVSTFAFQPEFDFDGRLLQSLLDEKCEQVSVSVLVEKGNTIGVITWSSSENIGKALALSLEKIPEKDKASALLRLCLSQSENVHFRPSWWDGLSESDRTELLRLVALGLPNIMGVRGRKDLMPVPGLLTLTARAVFTTWI